MSRIAVVTGGNKGIGLAIVERLAKELKDGWDVYLTARNEELGQESVKALDKKGVKVHFHQLDITSESSIIQLASFLKEKYGGLDILVNNAGIAYKNDSPAPVEEQAEGSLATNFFATLKVCQHLFPLLREHARVVNVSSWTAVLALHAMSAEKRAHFVAPMTMNELCSSLNEYISDVKAGNHLTKGWPNSCYGTSKLGVTVMSIIQQRELDNDHRQDLVVNACCPGSVDTDMSSHKGQLTPYEGADTPVYLALLPPDTKCPKGKHVSKREVQPWE